MEEQYIHDSGNFNFSGWMPEELTEVQYTLVTIVVDITGSVYEFADDLKKCMISAIDSCRRSPRAENLLIRVIAFNTNVYEIHGFKPLTEIDINSYDDFNCDNMTALRDATLNAIGATAQYNDNLIENDFECNSIVFIITDGFDNASNSEDVDVKNELNKMIQKELTPILSVLIGINAGEYEDSLNNFKDNCGITSYIDAGDVTEKTLARIAQFISESVSSASQALNSGTSLTASDLQL